MRAFRTVQLLSGTSSVQDKGIGRHGRKSSAIAGIDRIAVFIQVMALHQR